jgi:hypothetical protein
MATNEIRITRDGDTYVYHVDQRQPTAAELEASDHGVEGETITVTTEDGEQKTLSPNDPIAAILPDASSDGGTLTPTEGATVEQVADPAPAQTTRRRPPLTDERG